jgi:voltage-gated potassium channel
MVVSMIFGLSVYILASLIRIFEVPYYRNHIEYDIYAFDSIFNAIWLITMTVTTVGYGDIHPRTDPGKLICILAALWGAIMISLLVVTTTTIFDLEGQQLKAMRHINLSR